MEDEQAQTIALHALAWIAGNEELLPVFLGATGASLADLRRQAPEPAFQASVLDFLTMDDAWVIGFCDALGLKYDDPLRARQSLPGAGTVHWT
jgi:hypothetical protein